MSVDGGGGGAPANPPSENEDAEGGASPADISGETVYVPGGSPSDETVAATDPSITSVTPDTAVVGADATVTVTGERFGQHAVVEVDQVAVDTTRVSDTELTATLPDPGSAGTVSVTVRNPQAEQESNAVQFTFTAAQAQRRK